MAHFVNHIRLITILVHLLQCIITEQSTINYFYQDVDIERKNIVKRGLLSQLIDTIVHVLHNFTGGSFSELRFTLIAEINMEEDHVNCDHSKLAPHSTPPTGSVRTKNPVPQTTKDTAACGDNEPCSLWQINGFCENAFYPLEFRKRWCGVLCGLCTGV